MTRRRGFSLVEMLVALVVFSLVTGSALAFFRRQGRAFELGNERMDELQNVRFTTQHLEQQLRASGVGVPDIQPFLIYGGTDVVAFNANYASNVANDVFALYVDVDAPAGAVSALQLSQRVTLPNAGILYPDTTYLDGAGVNSPAETIVLFFRPDSTTTRTDDYALFRQVNGQAPELVSRNLLQNGSRPFFEYLKLGQSSGQTAILPVPNGQIPLRHTEKIHLSPADVAVIDSVRAIRVNFTGTNGRSGADERRRDVSRLITLPNAGLATRRTCGDAPIATGGLTATLGSNAGQSVVNLAWSASIDEAGGEKDVVRYVLWRRLQAQSAFGDPYLSIPAGSAPYTYTDAAVTSGDTYVYAVAAQDCTPTLSSLATANPVTIP